MVFLCRETLPLDIALADDQGSMLGRLSLLTI